MAYPEGFHLDAIQMQVLIGWGQPNVAISQTAVALKTFTNAATTGALDVTDIVAPWAGSIVGISYNLETNKTAGALSLSPTINGTEVASTNVLYRVAMANTTRTAHKIVDGQSTGLRFAAGDQLGFKLTTDGSFAPTTADLMAIMYVVFEFVYA